MKPSFALTLIIYAYLTPVFLWPHAVNTAIGAESDTPPAAAQEQAAGNEAQFRSPLFEALEIHASEEAGRQIAGSGEAAHRDPGTAWDKERAFAGMEGMRAEIVMLSGLHGAQRELLQWNRERIKTGRPPAVLPTRLCREAVLGAWCPLLPATFRAAGRHKASAVARSANTPAEHTVPNLSGNGPTKDELQ